MNEATTSSVGNGAARPKGRAKPERRKFDDDFKNAAVARVKNGEAITKVADSIPVVDSVLRNWVKKAGAKSSTKKGVSKAAKGKMSGRIVHGKRINYTEEFKRAAAQRIVDGEEAVVVATNLRVSPGSVRDWVKKYPTGTTPAKRKYERQSVTDHALPALAIRDAITYLKHVKTDMYALLQSGAIKEFEEYHLNTLAALRRLQSISTS